MPLAAGVQRPRWPPELPALDDRPEPALRRSARRRRWRTTPTRWALGCFCRGSTSRPRSSTARCARCSPRRWRRACSPTSRGAALPIDGLGFAVLIHPFTAGDAAGRRRARFVARRARHRDPPRRRRPAARPRHRGGARPAGRPHGPVEIEWVATGAEVTFLQMRPYRRPARAPTAARAARLALGRGPQPAAALARAGGAGRAGRSAAATPGFARRSSTDTSSTRTARAPRCSRNRPAARRRRRSLALEILDQPALRSPFESLEKALDAFLAIYEPLFGIVQPVARAAREALADFLRRHGIDAAALLPALLAGVPLRGTERAELARAFSPAPPIHGRRGSPRRLPRSLRGRIALLGRGGADLARDAASARAAAARARTRRRLAARCLARRRPFDPRRAAGVRTGNLGPPAGRRARRRGRRRERRRALRARAGAGPARAARGRTAPRRARLLRRADGRLLAAARPGPRAGARGVDRHARRDRAPWPTKLAAPTPRRARRRRRWPGRWPGTNPTGSSAGARAPKASSSVASGSGARTAHCDDAAADATEVIVARTILPTELPLIDAAALVVETGGPLDHVAAQARERGIPAVVGAAARTRLVRRRRSGDRRRRRGAGRPNRLTALTRDDQRSSASPSSARYSRITSSRLLSETSSPEKASVPRRCRGIPGHPDSRRASAAVPRPPAGPAATGCEIRCGRRRLPGHPDVARRGERLRLGLGAARARAIAGDEAAPVAHGVVRAGARARRRPPAPAADAGLIVPWTGGWPAPTLMTTLRRTTTPSAGLETCTGDRLSTVG